MLKKVSIAPAVALLAALFIVLPPKHEGRKIEMRNFRYVPFDIRIPAGGTVTFDNVSTNTHTATCVQCPAGVDTRDVQPGLRKIVTFRLQGTYIFACRYHQERNMIMRIRVGSVAEPSATPSGSPSPEA